MRIYRGLPGVRDAKVSLCWFHRSKSRKTASNGDDNRNESIIEALDVVGDLEDYGNETYNFDEYDAAMKEFEARLAREELEKQQVIIKQVFITSKGDGRDQATTDSQAPAAKDPQAAGAAGYSSSASRRTHRRAIGYLWWTAISTSHALGRSTCTRLHHPHG
jgi:hypothetical protein